jgi:hypothetical protein
MVASSRSGRGTSRCPGNGEPDPGFGDTLIITISLAEVVL